MSVDTAIILAGGLGTRLRDVVPNLPKPMAPINSRPFLEHQMDYWINQGIRTFILSVGYLKEVIINHFGDTYRGIAIQYAIEQTPLGTGGGLLLAAYDLSSPFIVLNGDTFIEVELQDLCKFHYAHNSEWTFSLFQSDQSDRYMGVDIDKSGKIFSLKSETSEVDFLANGGVYLINPSAIDKIDYQKGEKASLEDELLGNYISNGGSLYGMECTGKFIDIGVPEDYRRAESIISAV